MQQSSLSNNCVTNKPYGNINIYESSAWRWLSKCSTYSNVQIKVSSLRGPKSASHGAEGNILFICVHACEQVSELKETVNGIC